MSNYRLSARALIIKDDKILLHEFDRGDYYNLPGGGLELDESLRDAVKREVLEESGISVNVKELLYIYEYNPIRDDYRYGLRGALSHVFRCEVDPEIEISLPTVIDTDPTGKSVSTGCKWMSIEDLKKIHLEPKINDIIIDDYNKRSFSTKFLEEIH
jgi:8-oxo-dGTP diphosphatase